MGIKKDPRWVDYRKIKPKYFRCDGCARPVTRRSIKAGGCKACGSRRLKLPCRTNWFERLVVYLTRR
jgi:hypothetical protein